MSNLNTLVLPEPVTWLIERSAFRVSPHGQDAESNEWLEEAHEPGQEGFLYVKKVWAKASVIKDSLTQVSSILEKDCIHKEMYDTIALSIQQIIEVIQTTIAMSELDEFTVLH